MASKSKTPVSDSHEDQGQSAKNMAIDSNQKQSLNNVMLAVIGGRTGWNIYDMLKSVECYDFKENRWIDLCDMLYEAGYCGTAVVRGKVYVVGGKYSGIAIDIASFYG